MTILEKCGVKVPKIPETIEVYKSKEKGLLTEDTWVKMDEKKHNHATEEGNDYVVMDYTAFCKFQQALKGYVSDAEAVVKELKKDVNEAISEKDLQDAIIANLKTDKKNLEEKVEITEREKVKAIEERDKQTELNQNLLRIATERANKDRNMDKNGYGIKLLNYENFTYRYRHDDDSTDMVNLFKVRYQMPIDCSIRLDIVDKMVLEAISNDRLGLGKVMGGRQTMDETIAALKREKVVETAKEEIKKIEEKTERVSIYPKINEYKKNANLSREQINPFKLFPYGVVYARSYKSNVKEGYWEVTLTTDKAPEVRMELREKYAGEKKQGGKTNS